MKLIQALLILVLSMSAIGAHAMDVVGGIIGNKEMQGTNDLIPYATVFEDALVVFYRLKERKNDHLIGFSIARSTDAEGKLIWDKKDYILKPEVLRTYGFSPQPVALNDVLYLFGGEKFDKKEARAITFNRFTSLQDLINHAETGNANSPAQDTGIRIDHPEFVSVAAHDSDDIMISYYSNYNKRRTKFALCQPNENVLNCEPHDLIVHAPESMLNLFSLFNDGKYETMMLSTDLNVEKIRMHGTVYHIRNSKLLFYFFDFDKNDFVHHHSLPDTHQKEFSRHASGGLQIGDELRVYYTETESRTVHRTSLPLADLYTDSDMHWSAPIHFRNFEKKSDHNIHAKRGVSATEFKGRAYVFYHPNDRVARYFVD